MLQHIKSQVTGFAGRRAPSPSPSSYLPIPPLPSVPEDREGGLEAGNVAGGWLVVLCVFWRHFTLVCRVAAVPLCHLACL